MTDKKDDQELATVAGDVTPATVNIGGTSPVEISPLKVRQLPAFARALGPVLPALTPLFSEDGLAVTDLVGLMGEHGDDLIDAAAIGAGLDRDAIEELEPDLFVELALTVLRVNLDFFVQRLLPKVGGQLTTLTEAMQAAGSPPANG